MKKVDHDKLKKVRELEYELGGSHTDEIYKKESHRLRKKVMEGILLKYKKYFYKDNVLDYGCAEGIYCKFMSDQGFQKIFGCDISTLKIKEAKNRFKDENINFFDTDNFNYKIRYQLILCSEVLQHILNYSDTLKLFKEILCENGYLLISIPNLSKMNKHELANINNEMTVEDLLHQIGGAGFGKQNAIWKFNSELFFKEIQSDFELIELERIDTPDGEIKNLWTIGLLRKK